MTRLIDITDIYQAQTGEPETARAIIDNGTISELLIDGARLSRDWAMRVLGPDAVWHVELYEMEVA